MTFRNSKHLVSFSFVAAFGAIASAASAQPSSCDPNQALDKIALSNQAPCDVTGAVTAQNAANFAWNTFIAINWPAAAPFEPAERGVPRQGPAAPSANTQAVEAQRRAAEANIAALMQAMEALLDGDREALQRAPGVLPILFSTLLEFPNRLPIGLAVLEQTYAMAGANPEELETLQQMLQEGSQNISQNPVAAMVFSRITQALQQQPELRNSFIETVTQNSEAQDMIVSALEARIDTAQARLASRPDGSAPQWFNIGDTAVWSTWPEKRQLFRVRKDEFGQTFHYEKPLPFDQIGSVSAQPNTEIAMCASGEAPAQHLAPLQSAKIENFVDETDEVQIAILWEAGSDDLTEENLVRYQVKVNYDHYNDILTKNWWDGTTLPQAIEAQQKSGNGIGVVLASGSNQNGGTTGAILTKSAWKFLDSNIDNAGRYGTYYTQEALYYKINEQGKPCYETGLFGLIGLHIIRKTDAFPYLFFSTFEHNGNYPNRFNYANTKFAGKNSTPENPLFVSTLKNPYGIAYEWPQDPAPNKSSQRTPAYSATRLIQKSQAVQAANTEAGALVQGTVWANYSLVGVQVAPVSAPSDPGDAYSQGAPVGHGGTGLHPSYFSEQEFYLANPVIETNQRFQFFTGSFLDENANNVVRYQGDNPNAQNVGSKVIASGADAGTLAFDINMGGCMGCHGRAQKAGFSFSLKGAIGKPTNFTAETLKSKCVGEDADVFGDYNPETGVCTLLRTTECRDAVCEVNPPASSQCILAAVTNSDQSWTIDLSTKNNGSVFFSGTGSGLNNTPVVWETGSAVFETSEAPTPILVSYKVAGTTGVITPAVQANAGFADGTQTTLFSARGTGEESTFADLIATISCQPK